MKTFFTELQCYKDEAAELDRETRFALEPLYDKWKEYPLHEIFTIMSTTVFSLMFMKKTKIRRNRPTSDTIKDN